MYTSYMALLLALAMVVSATVVQTAAATNYTVGTPDGLWDLDTNYAEWVARKRFHPGDFLTFTYSSQLHDLLEVTKAAYDGCSSANNITASRTGNDVVALAAPGTRYFICGLTGHCDSGMKIRIDIVGAHSPAGGPMPPLSAAAAAGVGLGAAVLLLVLSTLSFMML